MYPDGTVVFVIDDDPLPMVFRSLEDAAGHMEAIDVLNGEYQALYTIDGRVVKATTSGSDVVLEETAQRDELGLRNRLQECVKQGRLTSDPDDLVAVADELLRRQWESRWPRWPRWLARRRRGDGPPQR